MIYDPFAYSQNDRTFSYYKQLREQGAILPAKHTAEWCFCRYDIIDMALKNPQIFSSPYLPLSIPGLIDKSQRGHSQQEARLKRALSSLRIRDMVELTLNTQKVAHQQLDRLDQGKPWLFDLVEAYAAPLPERILAGLLDIDLEEHRDVQRWLRQIVQAHAIELMPEGERKKERLAKASKSHSNLTSYLARLIELRRTSPKADLISQLIQGGDEQDGLSHETIAKFITMFLTFGHQTVQNLICNALKCMQDFPWIREEVMKNTHLIPALLKETLRFSAPLQTTFRLVKEDIQIEHHHLKKGDRVILLLGSGHHDEEMFNEPLTFNLFRDHEIELLTETNLHHELGLQLALTKAEIGLKCFLNRLPNYKLVSWDYTPSLSIRGQRQLIINPEAGTIH